MRRAATAASLVLLLAGASACSPTTYDATATTAPAVTTATTLPTGPAAQLLPELVAKAATLSAAITNGTNDGQIADQIADLWDAAKQEVGRTRPELLGDFDANVGRCATAVRFNRAADADKAYRNLVALVDTYLR